MCPHISIRGFVDLWVRGSVRLAFLKYRGNGVLKTSKHKQTHRIAFIHLFIHAFIHSFSDSFIWTHLCSGQTCFGLKNAQNDKKSTKSSYFSDQKQRIRLEKINILKLQSLVHTLKVSIQKNFIQDPKTTILGQKMEKKAKCCRNCKVS